MQIRRATSNDIEDINRLLHQVLDIHHNGRPDIFKAGAKKYTDAELLEIIKDDNRPIFVAYDVQGVKGYAFCIFERNIGSNILTDIKTLYIDDLCVDESARGCGVGRQLYSFVTGFARQNHCYNITLNVWSCNTEALEFYKKMGFEPQKIYMEKILGENK
jgi:ribosomal protein S18 acetylase RimI-like enzyme